MMFYCQKRIRFLRTTHFTHRLFIMLFFCIFTSCNNTINPCYQKSFPEMLAKNGIVNGDPLDVVILAGQSNMAGCGNVEEAKEYLSTNEYNMASNGINGIHIFACTDFASTTGGYSFLPYSDTTFGKSISSDYFGPEIGFALECYKAGRSLVIIKYCAGGISIAHFLDSNDLSCTMKTYCFSCLQELIKQGYIPTVKAVCWMQGENDCDYDKATKYYDNEKKLIEYMRKSFNPNLIFVDARVTDWNLIDPECHQDLVNNAKIQLSTENPLNFLIDSSGLRKRFDNAHYNTASTIELGRRFGNAVLINAFK